MEDNKKTYRKIRAGVVVSDKMHKTVVVKVERKSQHPLYGKPVLEMKKYMAHDESNECRPGDKVQIEETRPISRHKRWRVSSIIERAHVLGGEE